jgi:hypothetical protein
MTAEKVGDAVAAVRGQFNIVVTALLQAAAAACWDELTLIHGAWGLLAYKFCQKHWNSTPHTTHE